MLAGALSGLLTAGVYAAEDAFMRLPIHWMWWPALGGLVVGIGGFIFPRALGVGYDTIGDLLQGRATMDIILGVLFIKSTIWVVSLGSGTSGGVLAPLLMMGAALGALESHVLPNEGAGFWALVSMGAILGGTMRSPFTGTIFAIELTHDVNMLLPLFIAVIIAHGFTVLLLRRSILTEKVARRGFHLSREYSIDPLEILTVREVLRAEVVTLPPGLTTTAEVAALVDGGRVPPGQRLYPVVDDGGGLAGVVPRSQLERLLETHGLDGYAFQLDDLLIADPVVAYPDEPLRLVVERMAETGLTRFPVVSRDDSRRLVGAVGLHDLLQARVRNLEAERRRERVLPLRFYAPSRAEKGATEVKV